MRNGFAICMECGDEKYKFSEIENGSLFQYNDRTYMKVYYSSNQNLMVDIKTGESSFLSPETTVNNVLFTIEF